MVARRELRTAAVREAATTVHISPLERLPAELKDMTMKHLSVFDLRRLSKTSRVLSKASRYHEHVFHARAWHQTGRAKADRLSRSIAAEMSYLDTAMLDEWATPANHGSVMVGGFLFPSSKDMRDLALFSQNQRHKQAEYAALGLPLEPWLVFCRLDRVVKDAARLGPLIDRAHLPGVTDETELRMLEHARSGLAAAVAEFKLWAEVGTAAFRDCKRRCDLSRLSEPDWRFRMDAGRFAELRFVGPMHVMGQQGGDDDEQQQQQLRERRCRQFVKAVRRVCRALRFHKYAARVELDDFFSIMASAESVIDHLSLQWLRVLFCLAQDVLALADTLGWCTIPNVK